MGDQRVNRREVLAAGAAAGAALALPGTSLAHATWSRKISFASVGVRDGWPGWRCAGVANLRVADGKGVLEAGSDVFPCDPRPVTFAVDQRFRDGEVVAAIDATGAGAGVVVRRVAPREYYAAVLDDEQGALVIVRRHPAGVEELARADWPGGTGPVTLSLKAMGGKPTTLTATAGATTVQVEDAEARLQRAGDPGVLATARTLFPSSGPAPEPALGNLHLLPYGVQEGQAVMETAVGQAVLGRIRERSTAVFSEITVNASGRPGATRASVVAATSGAPLRGGAQLRVASDVPARVEVQFALNRNFRRSRWLRAQHTGSFDGFSTEQLRGLPAGRRVYWRARLRRRGRYSFGPVRSFKTLPRLGSEDAATIAIGACASQFGPAFDVLLAQKPDAFVWQGDLNYPDTIGPLAQTMSGYAGIWRDFLANPRLAPILEGALFAAQRDDHDYGVQDANSTNLVPYGVAPWNGLMQPRTYYRFAAGLAEFWVLDQRRFKTDPTAPDTPAKTLLGMRQRDWLLGTLAASRATFKIVCSPCTLALPANSRDGNWGAKFTTERDLLLRHIRESVAGRTIFVTGDTHWTMVYDRDGLFEARPCPLGIPVPNDITLTSPTVADDARDEPGVLYADQEYSHFALVKVDGAGGKAKLDLTMVREDGVEAFRRRFTG